jgi:hypothetical protein
MSAKLLTKNACIYSNGSEHRWLKARVLKNIPGVAEPEDDGFLIFHAEKLTFKAGGTVVTLRGRYRALDGGAFDEHIRGFKGWCAKIHADRPDFDLDFIHRYLDQVNQTYGIEVDQGFSLDSPVMEALVKITAKLDGLLFVHDSVIHGSSGAVAFGFLAELHADSKTTNQRATDNGGAAPRRV